MSVQKARQGYKLVKSHFGKYKEIPEEWNVNTIEDCCNILDSKRIPLNSTIRNEMKGIIPYYGANGVQGYINKHIFDEDLILLAEDGGYFSEYQTRPIAYYVSGKSWVNNHAHVLSNKVGFDLKWIFYSLVHKNILPWIKGSTRTKLNQSELRKIEIFIPTLIEQQKIASVLSNVDSLINQTQKVIDQTQKLKKGLMQKLLTRGIGHTKFKKVKWLFGKEIVIPEEWKMENLMNLGEPVIGLTYEPDNVKSAGILVLRAPNIQDGKLRFDDNVYVDVELMDRLKIRKGDLLICVRNGSKQLIGKCALVDRNFDNTTFGAFMSVFRSKENPFIYYQFQTPLIRKQITKSLTFTINQITNKDLNSFILPIPPTDEQQKIVSILSAIDSKIAELESKKSNLQKLKKGLMQKLLTGQMRVKV